MPDINPQQVTILLTTLDTPQQPHCHQVVKPIILPVARLEYNSQLQPALRLRRPRSLQENIRSIVRAEVVASIGIEDTCLRVREAPVCADVKNLAYMESVSQNV